MFITLGLVFRKGQHAAGVRVSRVECYSTPRDRLSKFRTGTSQCSFHVQN